MTNTTTAFFAHLDTITEKGDDFEIQFRVTRFADPEINTDTIEVTVGLIFTGNEYDGIKQYDADIHIGNGDFAGLNEMVAALAVVNMKFKELGLNTRFGRLTGE